MQLHLVTKSYFASFCKAFGLPVDDTKSFEAFGNYCAFARFSGDKIEASELTYEGPDPGIDGAFLFIEDRAVFSAEELLEIFEKSRREFHVNIVLTQVKSSIGWSKKDVDSFSATIADFFSEVPAQPLSQYLTDFRKMFRALFDNIGRIRNGRPDLRAFFISAAEDTQATEVNAAFIVGEKSLVGLGYWHECQMIKVHREKLHEMWLAADGPVEAKLPTIGYAPFPAAPNINNAYVATVSAADFVASVLKNPDGSPRKNSLKKMFEIFLA